MITRLGLLAFTTVALGVAIELGGHARALARLRRELAVEIVIALDARGDGAELRLGLRASRAAF